MDFVIRIETRVIPNLACYDERRLKTKRGSGIDRMSVLQSPTTWILLLSRGLLRLDDHRVDEEEHRLDGIVYSTLWESQG